MAIARGNKRLSVDLPSELYSSLCRLTEKTGGMSKGEVIEESVSILAETSEKVKKELMKFCIEKAAAHSLKAGDEKQYHQSEDEELAREFYSLAVAFNDFGYISFAKDEIASNAYLRKAHAKRIEIKNGYVLIPYDWITIDEEKAAQRENVYVVEVSHHLNISTQIPHFVIFSSFEELDEFRQENYLNVISNVYPKMKQLRKMRVEPLFEINEKTGEEEIVNLDLINVSPKIGFFRMDEYGKTYDGSSPFKGLVVRKEKEEIVI